jgi:NTP pyrophosphatase (non-canonical NTP hydrolase)
MSYQEDSIDWQAISDIDQWLDDGVSMDYRIQPLAQDWARIAKVIEELGEAVQAMIGYTGQNPRKGVTNGRDKVLEELADVVFTAILAIQHFTKNDSETRRVLSEKLLLIERRAGLKPYPVPDWRGKTFPQF